MKAVLAVVLLATTAFAATVSFNSDVVNGVAWVGYTNGVSIDKAGGKATGSFGIDAAVRPNIGAPGDGKRACMKVTLKVKSVNTGKIDVYARAYMAADKGTDAGTTDYGLAIAIPGPTGLITKSGLFDWTPNNSSGAFNWWAGVNVMANMAACSGCAKTADLQFSAQIGWTSSPTCYTAGATITWTPFLAVDGPNTFQLDASPTTGYQMQQVLLMPGTQTQPIYALITPDTASSSVTLVLAKMGTALPTDPKTVSSQDPTSLMVIPLGSSKNGNIRTGALPSLTAGNWLANAYVNTGSNWALGFGFGKEPSSAGMVVPSILVSVVLALAALLL